MLWRVKHYRHLIWISLLLVPSLACQAVMRLIAPPASDLSQSSPEMPPLVANSPTAAPSCLREISLVLREANNEHLPLSSFPNVDTTSSIDVPLVTYDIHGDQLSAPAVATVPPQLVRYQRDFSTQKAAWQLFTSMIPAEDRGMLSQFEIITDGPGGVLSAVEQMPSDATRWILETDIADMPDTKNLAFTLLHEYGHLLTLNSSQVPPDLRVFNNPDNTRVRERAVASCATYFPGEGCSLSSSYVNSFFNDFWKGLFSEWSSIDQINDEDRRDARLRSFYRKYSDQFVDSYAASSPVEDIAETWAYFVLSPRPTGESLLDQKMSFFYGYPELVSLREHVRAGLCAAMP